MRISEPQIKTILRVSAEVLAYRPAEIFLYGSRADDSLSGGDIDLVLVASSAWPEEDLLKQFELLAKLKKQKEIGDRKINLSLISRAELNSDEFWKTVNNKISLGLLG